MQMKSEAAKKSHEIKNAAIAFGVYGDGSKRLGDIAVTGKGLVWSKGTSKSAKDVTVKWDAFINWMQSQLQPQATTVKTVKSGKAAKAKVVKPRAKAAANGAQVRAKAAPAKKAPAKSAAKAKPAGKKAH